jgi:hypothetical protein
MRIATDFIILRNIQSHGLVKHDLDRQPVMVATLLNEQRFNESGHALHHRNTVLFEDETHDWSWRDNTFRYFTRFAEYADVLVIFAYKEVVFCCECGLQKPDGAGILTPCRVCHGVQP